MFDRFMEYKEAQQFRKDRMMRQRMRHLFIFMTILGVLLLVISVVNAISPPAESAAPIVSTQKETQKTQEIHEFAEVVTKPMDTLTQEDFDLLADKAGDPCYAENVSLPEDQMIEAITDCESRK